MNSEELEKLLNENPKFIFRYGLSIFALIFLFVVVLLFVFKNNLLAWILDRV